MGKKLNLISIFLLFIIILNTNKIKSNPQLNIKSTINKNKIEINSISNNLSLYEENNKLFKEMKQILKNISFGEELFEDDYNYLNTNLENNIKYDESLEHRLIPETLFEYKKAISCFNFISTKSITKDDTGHFVSILLLVCQNNSIVVSDLLGNIYLTYNITEEINDIITFNQNDINDFYLITKNFTEIKKFILLQGILYKTNNNYTNNESEILNDINNYTIDVDTYAEDLNREKIEKLSYKLKDIYKQSINEERIKIFEEKDIFFNLINNSIINNSNNNIMNNDEHIININPVIVKGVKSLIVITNKKSVYKLNYKNLDIISHSEIIPKNIGNYSNILSPISMTSFYILFNKLEKGFITSKIDNISCLITTCELFPKNSSEKIKNYYFDQKSRTFYILSNLFNVYLVTPMITQISSDKFKNSCRIILLCSLNKIISNNTNIYEYNYDNFILSLLDKKLMMTKNGIDFEVIDLTKIGEVDDENKLQTKIFSLSRFINNQIKAPPLIIKNNNKFLVLYQISKYSLLLFNFYEKNSKVYISEPQSFNFKVPIILVAFIVILVWNYIKKNNEYNGIGDIDYNNMEKLKEIEKKK